MKAVVRGIGIAGGFGNGLDALEQALRKRKSPTGVVSVVGPGGRTVEAPSLAADDFPLDRFVSLRALRRVDRHTRLAMYACFSAMEDAGGLAEREIESMGIAVGSGYGSTCNTFELEGFGVHDDILRFSPIQFSNSVHNAAGAHIAAFIKSNGPNVSVNQFDLSFPAALATACHWLEEERASRVVVGCVDDYSRIMALHRHERLSSPDAPAFLPPVGEGSVFFLLDRDEETPSPYGQICEAGIRNGEQPRFPAEDGVLTIVGADGFTPEESRYARWIGKKAAVYTPIYGHLPVGMGFDLAVAALSFKRNTLFASAEKGEEIEGLPKLVSENRPLESGKIRCIKLSQTEGVGYATLESRLTAGKLLRSGLVGLWEDRKDISDSSAYARQLREQAQTRREKDGSP